MGCCDSWHHGGYLKSVKKCQVKTGFKIFPSLLPGSLNSQYWCWPGKKPGISEATLFDFEKGDKKNLGLEKNIIF